MTAVFSVIYHQGLLSIAMHYLCLSNRNSSQREDLPLVQNQPLIWARNIYGYYELVQPPFSVEKLWCS